MKTISELTGLAVPTVSRALNDAPDIGEATKVRVRETAARIGYIPNRAGVRLRTGKTNVVSLVLSTEHDMMNFTARLISSVASTLRTTPYHMIVTPYTPNENPMVPVRYLVETGSADAIILNQTQPEDPRVAYLLERGFPFVTHGRTDWCDKHPYVDFDNRAFGALAVEKLVARGRRNLLLIAPPQTHSYSKHMIAGARTAAAEAGIELTISPLVTSDSTSSIVRSSVETAVTGKMPVDGIVCGSTNSALGTVAGLEAAGLQLGKALDVVAKEPIPFLELFRPEMIVVQENVAAAGEALARAALQANEKPDEPPVQILFRPEAD